MKLLIKEEPRVICWLIALVLARDCNIPTNKAQNLEEKVAIAKYKQVMLPYKPTEGKNDLQKLMNKLCYPESLEKLGLDLADFFTA